MEMAKTPKTVLAFKTMRSRNPNGTFSNEMDPIQRFFSLIKKTDGCWLWTGPKKPQGYGIFQFERKLRGAHRLHWFLVKGKWPKDCLLHECDNPWCVRLDHLHEGSNHENVLDRHAKGRSQSLFQKGIAHHAYRATPEVVSKMIQLRKAGSTQQEIADATGVSRSRVAAILLQKGLSYGKGNQSRKHLGIRIARGKF